MGYRPKIKTFDLWPAVGQHVGSLRHASLIDEIESIQGPVDEKRLVVYHQTRNYEDAGRVLGVSADLVIAWLRNLRRRVNRCPGGQCCGRR